MSKSPHILVTNDDGITSPGLLALVQAMRALGTVSVLAPERNWSGGGHVKTLDRPLRVKESTLSDGSKVFASYGAPSDCVSLAVLGYFRRPIDLVVSGINAGANLGHDVTYSGTVTAAMEAVIAGLPAVAISLEIPDNGYDVSQVDYLPAARVAQEVVSKVLRYGLPQGTLLNVNVPALPERGIRGIRLTRQGLRVYHNRLDERVDPRGKPYYWIGGDFPTGVPEVDTDVGALAEGYVAVTPLQLDLTAYRALEALRVWAWEELLDKEQIQLHKPALLEAPNVIIQPKCPADILRFSGIVVGPLVGSTLGCS